MKLIVLTFLFAIATNSFSQEKGKIRGGINVFEYYFSGATGLDLQIGYNLLDNMNVGFKFGVGNSHNSYHYYYEKSSHYYSYLGTFSYYFSSGKKSFVPFVGSGMGMYDIMLWHTDISVREKKIGSFLTTGFEAKPFRMALEYNFVPNSVLYHNNYFGVTIGFYVGGGKWKRTNRLSGFVDKKGDLSIPSNYNHVIEFSDGLAGLKVKKKWGFIDEKIKEVIPFKYEEVGIFSEGLARVKLKNKWGFIDKTGRLKIDFKYDEVDDFSEGQTRVKQNQKWIVIDKTGKEICTENLNESQSDVTLNVPTSITQEVTLGKNIESKNETQTLNADIVTLCNGDEIKVKVMEITLSEIKYKRFDNLDGPTITIPKTDVFAINYSNGTREVIKPIISTRDVQSVSIASKNAFIIGGNFIVGTGDDYAHVGFGAKLSYNVANHFRISGEFDYFPTKDYLSWWNYTLYGDFLISTSDKFAIYPSVGVGGVGIKVKELSFDGYSFEGSSANKFALSAGLGFDYALSPHLIMNTGFRVNFIFLDNDNMQRYNFILGLGYKF